MNRNRIAFVVLAFGALFAILMLQQPAGLSAGGGPIEVNTPLDVDDDNQCDQVTCSLREAIDLANDTAGPNEIMVPAGIYTLTLKDPPEDANGSGDLDILDDLTINGAGPGNTVIEQDLVVIGQPFDRIFHLHGVSLTLNGVTLRQGREQDGGDGGGIYSEPNSDLHINDSTLTGLETDGSGGAIYAASPSSIVITDSLFESNIGMSGGGALFLEDGLDNTVLIENSVFNLNGAQNGGAMKIGVSDSLVINDSDFTNNEAMDQTPMCSPCLSRGGAIDAPAVHVQMTGGEISGNTSHHGGGGGMHASSATIDGTEITGNRTLGTKLDGYRGGGIRVVSDAIISNALIAGNEASGDGGGIFGGESTIITDSAISTNSASNGGGVSSIGDLQIYTSLIGGNEASDSGGGVLISEGTAHIENSTISANSAESGGAVYRANTPARIPSGVQPPGPAQLAFVTIATNTAPAASAIADAPMDGLLTLRGSIVAGNTGSPNCAVALISLGYNIEDGNSCGLGQAGDQPNTDPLLLALAENGGPTQTHALMTGSPAIDIADPACPPPGTDQRGISRPLDGDVDSTALCDIGAFEAPGEPPTPSPTPGVTPTPTPTPVPTPTPTGGPTPTPTPTPTEPPEAEAIWGDDDCNLALAATDALKKLQDIAAIPYEVEPGCPALGDTVNVQPAGFGDLIWGDTDCDGDYDAVDALQILRSIAALPTNEEPECPEVGAEVVIA